MNIGVLGAGVIGGTLARRWTAAGHSVKLGVRNVDNPEVLSLVRDLGRSASVGSTAEAIAFGEAILFAITGGAMEQAIQTHARALGGKIVIDAANRMGGAAMNSIAEFQRHAPQAKVFRAFNSLGWENFADPHFGSTAADLFYCGPAGEARDAAERLIADVGLRPIYVGGPEQARLVDMVASLWFALANGQKMGRHLAFKVLTR